ncbi:MAG: hypothetical protein KDJ77_02650 [Rhodobiaceae bacterium]|nr:hypothetical protein [Rhodobiaceae bacterium]
MADITLSKAVRSNLLNLQNTADSLAKTQQRLASGLKVNSALDNPTNFFTASALNSRSSDLSRLLDSVSNATQTLEAADNGISAISKLVESAQASARQALQATGRVTESKVVGSSSATFNPEALTSISGDNSVATGTGAGPLGLDAAASITTGSFAADLTNIADIAAVADFDTGAADGSGLLSDASPGGPGLAAGDSVRLQVNGVNYTLNFDASTAAGAARTGSAAAGYNITIGVDQTQANLDDTFNTLLAGSGVSADDGATDDALTFSFTSAVDTVVLSDFITDNATEGNGATLTKLGLNTQGTAYASGTADRIIARNSDFEAFLGAAGNDGETLQVQFGSTSATLTFGTGAGEISTKEDLLSSLNAISGVTATGSATAAGTITLDATDDTDYTSAFTLTAGNSDTNTLFSFDVSSDDAGIDLDSTTALVTTANAQNLITQGAVSQGETLEVKVGDSTKLTITFGTNSGSGQVQTIGELNAALQDLAGGAASVDGNGEINITADNAGDSIVIGGSSGALASFGLTAGEANSLIDGTNIASGDKLTIQVGSNNALTITFGTGTGQVNTQEELTDALGNLAGGTASIDSTTGAITIEATQGTDSITVSSTDSLLASKDAVAASFGLNQGTTASVTTDSATRKDLRAQFNELLVQIDELAEDSGFNGVNLLGGDDLKVIFNEDGSSKLDIGGVNFDSSSLGLSRLSSGYFQTDSNIEDTLDTLDTVISTLRSQASKFGSNLSVVETRQNFTKDTINTLETGAANLTLADLNEEGANLLALQTRQQLSTTALSLSAQADQNVLRLF